MVKVKVFLLIILFISNAIAYAQTVGDAHLWDQNCHSYYQTRSQKLFVKGGDNSRILRVSRQQNWCPSEAELSKIPIDQYQQSKAANGKKLLWNCIFPERTERQYHWQNITNHYQQTLSAAENIATSFYQPRNYQLPLSSAAFYGCQGSIHECPQFALYCTEQLTGQGLQEDIEKWSDKNKICSSESQHWQDYRKKNPKACDRNALKEVEDLLAYAKKLASLNHKSPELAQLMEQAVSVFDQARDNLARLQTEQKHSLALNEVLADKEQALEQAKIVLEACDDFAGIGSHSTGMVRNELGHCQLSPMGNFDDQIGLAQFAKDIAPLKEKLEVEILHQKAIENAINTSVRSIWISQELWSENFDVKNSKQAMEQVCLHSNLCGDPSIKKQIQSAYSDFLKDLPEMQLQKISSPQKALMASSINKSIEELNQACKQVPGNFQKAFAENEQGVKTIQAWQAARESRDSISREDFIKQAQLKGDMETKRLPTHLHDHHVFNQTDALVRDHYKQLALDQAMSGVYDNFQAMLAGHAGPLFVTDHLKATHGLDPIAFEKKCFYQPQNTDLLPKIKESDLENASQQLLSLQKNELQALGKNIDKTRLGQQKDFLKDYIRTHPKTIAEIIKTTPDQDYAYWICMLVKEANQSERNWDMARDVFRGAGVLASVVAAPFTGGGSLLLIGAVMASGEASFAYQRYQENQKLQQNIQRAVASDQADLNQSLQQLSLAYQQEDPLIQDMWLSPMIAFGSEVVGVGILKGAKFFGPGKAMRTMASKITPKNKPPLNFHHEQVLAEGADLLKQNSRHLKNRTGAFAQMDDATYSKVKDLFLGSEQAQGIGKILSHQEQAQLQIILRGIPEEKIPEFMGLLAQHLDNPMAMRSFLTEFSSFADDLIIDGAIEYQKLTQKIIQHQQGLIPGTQITVTEAFAEVAPARASPKIQGATGKEYAEVFEMDPKYLHEANPDIPFDPNAALFGLERAGRPFKGVVKRISDPKELLKYEVFVDKSGRLVDSNGIAISTRNKMTGDKKAIFVMDSKGRIFVSDQQQIGLFHHSTLSNGEKVATAGEIVIEDGKIISVNSRSGHYQPSDKSLKQLVVELEERKADIASIEIRNYSDRIISPEKIGLRRVPAQSTPVNFNPKELTSAEHHVVFGNLADGHSGKVLHGGMHTQQGLEELLKANSELRVLMQNKPHLIETLENGVKKVMLPRSAFNKKHWNSLKFSSSNGGKAHCRVIDGTEYCQKTLFPADFDLDKIRQSIEHLQQSAFSRKTALNNGLTSIEGVHGDLRLRMILDENNNLITIHPSY